MFDLFDDSVDTSWLDDTDAGTDTTNENTSQND
jgi:hypothetical protein